MRVAALSLLALPALATHAGRQIGDEAALAGRQLTIPMGPFGTLTMGTAAPTSSPSLPVKPTVAPTPTPSGVKPTASVSGSASTSLSSGRPTSLPPSSSSSLLPSSSSNSTSIPPPSSSSSSSVLPSSSEESSSESPEPTSEPASKTVVYITVTKPDGKETLEPAPQSSSPDPANSSTKLGTGPIVGIVIGALAIVAILATIFILLSRRKRHDDDDAIRWPELNRHGDTSVVHALPARRTSSHGVGERRMSLGSDLDGPSYHSPEHSGIAATGPASSPYGTPYSDGYDNHHQQGYSEYGHSGESQNPPYTEDYTNMPPPVLPQASPVHGVQAYDWESDAYGREQYPSMQRQESPPMTGVGAGGVSFPQAPNHHTSHY